MSGPAQTFEVVSIFPEMFSSVLSGSLLGKAIARGVLAVHFTDPRDFAPGKHRSVDDTPYGGGSGMVMRPEPLALAVEHAERERGPAHKVLLSPDGKPLDQAAVVRLAKHPRVLLVCGRYEGIDERVRGLVDEEISIGDYVLTGGEIAAMAIVDACSRRLPGVLGNEASALDESFEAGLLEYPQYTRPPEFRGATVPEVLLSGDHEKIRRWRRLESLRRTRARRPDLFARHAFSDEDRALLGDELPPTANASARRAVAARTFAALVHHPVYDRERRTITSALTNLDLHDLARSTRTYGLAGYFIVTPIEAQRDLARRILDGWRDEGAERNEHRREALERVRVVGSVEEARAEAAKIARRKPLVVGTSAREGAAEAGRAVGYGPLVDQVARSGDPLLVLFGTGWGLADEVLDRVDRTLPPIQREADYNHLSVRSAAAIVLDRLFGDKNGDPAAKNLEGAKGP